MRDRERTIGRRNRTYAPKTSVIFSSGTKERRKGREKDTSPHRNLFSTGDSGAIGGWKKSEPSSRLGIDDPWKSGHKRSVRSQSFETNLILGSVGGSLAPNPTPLFCSPLRFHWDDDEETREPSISFTDARFTEKKKKRAKFQIFPFVHSPKIPHDVPRVFPVRHATRSRYLSPRFQRYSISRDSKFRLSSLHEFPFYRIYECS